MVSDEGRVDADFLNIVANQLISQLGNSQNLRGVGGMGWGGVGGREAERSGKLVEKSRRT